MANRVSDSISILPSWKPSYAQSLPESCSYAELDIVRELAEDFRTQKNSILYSPPEFDRFSYAFESGLPLALEYHKKLVFIVRNEYRKQALLKVIRAHLTDFENSGQEHPFLALDLTGFAEHHNEIPSNHSTNAFIQLQIEENEFQIDRKPSPLNLNKNQISKIQSSILDKSPPSWEMLNNLAQELDIPLLSFLSQLITSAHIIICSYDDVFSFHPLQPSLFKNLLTIDQSIPIFDDCHLLQNYVKESFSFRTSLVQISNLQQKLGELYQKNSENSHYQFTSKFLRLFLKYLGEVEERYAKYHSETEFRGMEFMHHLCDIHRCSMDHLQNTLLNHFHQLLSDPCLKSEKILSTTVVNCFNLFFLLFQVHMNAKIPYSLILTFEDTETYLSCQLIDPRFYTDAMFSHSFASLSMSEALDVRMYLAISGLGSLSKGFIIHSLTPSPKENKMLIWGDISVNPRHHRSHTLLGSQYAAKIVHHANIISQPILVLYGSTSLFNTIQKQDLEQRLGQVNRDILYGRNNEEIKLWEDQLKQPAIPGNLPIALVDLSKVSFDTLLPWISRFSTYFFISFPFPFPSLETSKSTGFLTRKYDVQRAKMYQINAALSKVHGICANAPHNHSQAGLIIFYDGLILDYQKYLLPWIYQQIGYAPSSSNVFQAQVDHLFA